MLLPPLLHNKHENSTQEVLVVGEVGGGAEAAATTAIIY